MTNSIIVDGHLDIAWNYLNNGRDFRRSVEEHRYRETDPVRLRRYGRCMVGLPEIIQARIALTFASIFVSPSWSKMYPDERYIYDSPEEAYRLGQQQLNFYHELAEKEERVQLVLNRGDLEAVLATWGADKGEDDHQFGIVISMEGADPILEPAQLEEWHERGLRIIGLAWTKTRYAGGTKAPGPLTDLGRELLQAMQSYHMPLDLSHLTPEGLFEALDQYGGPIFASHANPLRFRPDRPDRNFSDDVIRQLAQRDGVMGIIPYNLFLVPGWAEGDRKDAATMDTVIAAIDHVCQLTGTARHVGIGSDFDGGFGTASTPAGFDSIADLPQIGAALSERGYHADDVQAILSGNFLRVIQGGLPAS